ncbi:MAG TPA: ABC transporter permease, partial [Chitinophagaceae bacterium]|nr:ABC transporter permease [Chitinophagaceae bacterium]
MLKNLLLAAMRNLKKSKFFTLLNILGLAVGMAVFMLIVQYVTFERSYEDFIPNANNIYRVGLQSFRNNEMILNGAENYPAVGPAMLHDIPGVAAYARLYNMGYKNNVVITNENARPQPISFKQERFLYADSAFLPMMGYNMVEGNAVNALSQPNTCVISEKYARMYFGNEDPIGKTLHMRDDDFNDETAKVTAVFKEVPANTHLKFDVLYSYKTLFTRGSFGIDRYDQSWSRADMYTFVQLQPATDAKTVESKLPAIITKYKPQLVQAHESEKLFLQPLKSIHLHSDLAEEPETNGNVTLVFFINLIGIFVLVIAWINYINLATARAVGRAKEVGVRKVIGAVKHQLIIQFLTESAVVNFFALLLAYGIALLALKSFNTISGLSLAVSYFIQPWFIALVASLWLAGSLLSGFYPAWVLSSFKPVVVLKGKLKSSSGGVLLRKGLVVTQFIASVALIAGTFTVYKQLNFMTSRNLGMNINQVLVMNRPGNAVNNMNRKNFNRSLYFGVLDAFRNELKRTSDIQFVSSVLTVPGKQREYKTTVRRYGANSNDSIIARINSMDYDFMDVFRMNLVAGRNFSKDFPKDADTSVIVTETAAQLLGFKRPQDAIGQTVAIPEFGNFKPIIVGVVNDYHQVSFKKALEPSVFLFDQYGGEYYALRVNTNNLPLTIQHVKDAWVKTFPGNPFDYFFLDDYFNKQYVNEERFGKLFSTFSVLAIILSCLGLFGLSAYTATQRVKEIGIRKVLGASVTGIAAMLSKDFLKLVIISAVIATPVVWLVMHKWLQSFAYRTAISWWIFPLAGIMSLFIALVTVSYQAVKA